MGVDLCRFTALMAQQFLNVKQVCVGLQQVSGLAVA